MTEEHSEYQQSVLDLTIIDASMDNDTPVTPMILVPQAASTESLDLTIIDQKADSSKPIRPDIIAPSPYNPQREREGVRSRIAQWLILLLAITVIVTFILFGNLKAQHADLKDLLVVIYPPLIGIIGTVLGFYFGAEVAKPSKE